jgi:conjugative relaxase-like TrwC/TraI family protein
MRGVEAVQSLGKLVASQASYYTEQLTHSVGEDVPLLRGRANGGQADYYAGHESPSRWMGSGLDRLHLEAGAPVDPEVFAGLMAHRAPDGQKMSVPRSHGNLAGFDHTFSAPKSVSLLYAYGNKEIKEAVVGAHRQAVSDAVGYMEERCARSRVSRRYADSNGESGFTSRPAGSEGYVAAGFDHFTSRANDPQVHTHVVVINRVWAEDGWRAIDAKPGYAHLKAGGTVYQSTLRAELTQRLGVSWQPVKDGMADIAGFSPELLRHFSTRRTEIEEAVARYVAETRKEAHPRVWQKFTLETRQPKSYPRGEMAVTREMKDYGITTDVIDHWEQRALIAPEDVRDVVQNAVRVATPSRLEAFAVDPWTTTGIVVRVADRRTVFTERDLLPHVAALHPHGAAPTHLVDSARRVLEAGLESGAVVRVLPHRGPELRLPDGIELSNDELAIFHHLTPQIPAHDGPADQVLPGEARYTTRIQLQREQQILEAVIASSPVTVAREALEAVVSNRRLVGEQGSAVRHLADLDGRLVTLVGPGGSGKTRAVGVYADAARTAGHHVIGVATSATAARRLGEELSGSWSGTIAMMRHQLDTYETRLRAGTVIIVDEASMVSTRDLAWLVEQAEHCNGKIVLVGDPKQLPSIDSGGLFHRIVADGHGVVTDLAGVNQRQTLELDRKALNRLRQGEIESAVHDYTEAGRVHLGNDEYATKAAMAEAWWNDTQTHGADQVRMLASRRDEVAMLNQLARVHMQAEGHLRGPVLANRWGTEFQAGDRIVVRDNWYAHADLRNGQTGTITITDPNTGSLTFRRDVDGATVDLPRCYVDASVDHAYAQTIHTAQGQTFQTTHLYVDTGVAAEHGYTGLSRARGETHLWVNTRRSVDGRCIQPHGQPAFELPIESLVRQLTRTVVQPPAGLQGVTVGAASDQQLNLWLGNLDATIREGPLGKRLDVEDLTRIEGAIAEAEEVARMLGTYGARSQVRYLEDQRQQLLDQIATREHWIESQADLLHTYATIKDELQARTAALVVSYQLRPPQDVLEALGPRPTNTVDATRWDAAARRHAEARIRLGPAVDLADPAVLEAASWRTAIDRYVLQPDLERGPVLRLAG